MLSGFPSGATFSVGHAGSGADAGKWVIDDPTEIASLGTTPLRMTPPSHYVGSFTLHIDAVATDLVQLSGGAETDTRTTSATIAVTIVPDTAPVAQAGAASGNEDTTITGAVVAIDAEGASLTYSVVAQPGHGSVTLNQDGSFSYTPDGNYFGVDSFTYKVNDGVNDSNVALVNLTINAVNDAPVAQNATASGDEDTVITGPIPASDPEGAALGYTVVAQPGHGSITLNFDGNFIYTPDADYFGSDSFTWLAYDASLDSNVATVSLTVNGVNDRPVVVETTTRGDEDTTITGTLTASDADGDTLAYTLVTQANHGTVTLNLDGSFSYTPDENYSGNDSFVFRVSDGHSVTSASGFLQVGPINDAPVAQNGSASGDEDTTITGTVTASDVDNASLTYTVVAQAGHGSVTLNQDGSFSYTPNANYFGSDSFTWKVNDGSLDSNVATVNLTVNGINDRPVVVENTTTGDEDTTITGSLTASDADGDTLVYTLVTQANHGTVTLNLDGSFSYTPNENYSGNDSFVFRVSDGHSVSSASGCCRSVPSTMRRSRRTVLRAATRTPRSPGRSWPAMSRAPR